MKAITIIASLQLFAHTYSHAQLSFGIKGGYNSSAIEGFTPPDLDGETSYTTKAMPGFHCGAFINRKFSNIISTQAELLYTQKGAKMHLENSFSWDIGGSPITTNYVNNGRYLLQYIEMPLMIRVSTRKKTYNLFVEAGPYFSYGLKGVVKSDGTYSKNEVVESHSYHYNILTTGFTKEFKRSDYGLAIGTGTSILLDEKHTLYLHAGYKIGLYNIKYPNPYSDYSIPQRGEVKNFNRTLNLSVSYMIAHRNKLSKN